MLSGGLGPPGSNTRLKVRSQPELVQVVVERQANAATFTTLAECFSSRVRPEFVFRDIALGGRHPEVQQRANTHAHHQQP